MDLVKVGNSFYFMYIGCAAAWVLLLFLILRKVPKTAAHAVLTVLLFCNFALHFIKQAFPPYTEDPNGIIRSGLQNLCAVSTVFFPFIYLIRKQNILHDFVYFMGVCGGLAALVYPTEALNMPPFVFDTIRFYICHTLLLSVPFVAALLGIYRPRLRRFWAIPLMFLVWEGIICLYEFCLAGAGIVGDGIASLFDPGFRNSSFTFGVRPDFAWASAILDPFVPKFLRTDYFNVRGGQPFYFPVLWLTGPAIVILIPLYTVLTSPFWLYALGKRMRRRRALLKRIRSELASE